MPASDNANGAVSRGLVLAANMWAERGRTKAKTERIRQMIEVGTAQSLGAGKWQISIYNKAPEAAAYEFGSGLKRTRGTPAKYRIDPVNNNVLVFPWSPAFTPWGSPKFYGKVGQYHYFWYVEHPGVDPAPHMKPALDEVKDQMRQVIGQEFSVNVVHKSIREAWLAK